MRQVLCISILVITGCDGNRKGPPESAQTPVQTLVLTDEQPATYELADSACQTLTAPLSLTKAMIHTWRGDLVIPRAVSLSQVVSAGSLTSPAILETTFNDHYLRSCYYNRGGGERCPDAKGQESSWSLEEPARPLRICRDDSDYPRLSYERVGLGSLHAIESASSAYRRADGGLRPLRPIHLSILPNFVDLYRNVPKDGVTVTLKTWITHNMAYFPSVEMIAVFPEPASLQASLKGYYWESEFVLAHEFGHHIELSRNATATARLGLAWNPMQHRYLSVTGDPSATAQVMGSFSEAVADLLAYYAVGGDNTSLSGLPCLGLNRDPGRDHFGNGDFKALTEDRLDTMLGYRMDEASGCSEPRYSDVHIGGAIFAGLLNDAFAALTAIDPEIEPGSPEDIAQRYKLSLRWQDALGKRSKALTSSAKPQELLALLPLALEDAVNGYLVGLALNDSQDTSLRQDLCAKMAERVPVIEQQPFGC